MKPIYILHEGKAGKSADNQLIKLLLEDLKLDCTQIEFHGMGIKSNFFKDNQYAYFKQPVETDQIKKILHIVDADYLKNDALYGGFENTKKELENMIIHLGFQEISQIYIMCDPNTNEGYLESFILSTIPSEQRNCIESFLTCSQFKSKESDKAIINQIYKIAYPNHHFDFTHKNFEPLKSALKSLFL